MSRLKIDITSDYFLKKDGTFDKDSAIKLSGKYAGECYDREGFCHLLNEDEKKTMRRVDLTLNNGHHSVYDQINISLNLQNVPKILAMVLNNEHQYTTSKKSARYTPVVRTNDAITLKEEELYNKWIEIFKIKIKEQYGDVFNDSKITKLAQENARYLVSVFMPTQLIYSTSLRQFNYIASFMKDYIDKADKGDYFQNSLAIKMQDFYDELGNLNILEEGLLRNEKCRSLSLFGDKLNSKEIYFGDVYSTVYNGSFAELAQAQRHRTLDYQMERLEQKDYFVPPIISDDEVLTLEWLNDMRSVADIVPQGELVRISEEGKYEDFILKCKERLCSAAQLEIMHQTRVTLLNYKEALESKNHHLASDIIKYTNGARCTFPDFSCASDCGFKEGKSLTRKI